MVLAPTADGIADLHVVGRDAFGDATRRSATRKNQRDVSSSYSKGGTSFQRIGRRRNAGKPACRRCFNLLPCRYKVVDSREAGQKEGVPGFILTELRNRLAPSVVTRPAKLVWHTKVRPSGMAARFL